MDLISPMLNSLNFFQFSHFQLCSVSKFTICSLNTSCFHSLEPQYLLVILFEFDLWLPARRVCFTLSTSRGFPTQSLSFGLQMSSLFFSVSLLMIVL